mgnify:CR=1 FL=1
MPSFVYTPEQLNWVGGEITLEPIRLSYSTQSMAWVGSAVTIGPNLESGLSALLVKLDRLQRAVGIADKNGVPTVQFQALWQRTVESIEAAFTQQGAQIAEISDILAAIQTAQDTATQAAQTAQGVSNEVSLANSTTVPVDGNLSASSSGVVTIAAHQRKYSNKTVNVDSGSITGFAPGSFVRVYYNDSAQEGGAVTYQGTISEIQQSGSVHIVGGVLIPEIGQPNTAGTGTTPPGYVRPDVLSML